jgi:hypothetical protein
VFAKPPPKPAKTQIPDLQIHGEEGGEVKSVSDARVAIRWLCQRRRSWNTEYWGRRIWGAGL